MEEKEHKGLPVTAYEEIPGEDYEPYIPAKKEIPEMTVLSVILGIILAVGFGVAMVYVGLKIGMTISASVPAAVLSMGILKGIFKRGTILENNIVQTIASAGESLAAGVIFTIPAAYLWPEFNTASFSILKLSVITLIGGALGVLLMIPLRKFLIVQEHGKLKYPEGTACAEVLVAGDIGGNPAKLVFGGIAVGAIFKFFQKGFCFWKEICEWEIPWMKNLVFSIESSPILLAVGYIIGLKISALMLAGGMLAWFVLIPLITHFMMNFGPEVMVQVKNQTIMASQMNAGQVWEAYIRYIGAGAVAFGGMISLAKALPTIGRSFKISFIEFIEGVKHAKQGKKREIKRTDRDLPLIWVLVGAVVLIIGIALTRTISDNIVQGILGAVMVFVFGFFFVTVSSRIVGLVGSSSNPVSGMTIGTLIMSCLIFRAIGFTGIQGMVTSLLVGAFVCIAMCMAGDVSQDLKTGFLLGATPWKQQVGQIIGIAASSVFVIMILLFLKDNVGFAGMPKPPGALPGVVGLKAPQANLMAIVIRGIMEGNLPWTLVLAGGFIAVCVELLGAPALPFAVGLYLPLELSTPIMVGGGLSYLTGKFFKKDVQKQKMEKGVLVSSGLIAGDALMGILIIGLTAKGLNLSIPALNSFLALKGIALQIPWGWTHWRLTATLAFLAITGYLWFQIWRNHNGEGDDDGKKLADHDHYGNDVVLKKPDEGSNTDS